MKNFFLIMIFSILAVPIDSTEVNIVNDAMKNGQCTSIRTVVQCETKELSVSIKYKDPQ